MLESNAPDLTVPVDDFFDVVSNNVKKAAAVKAFEAVRAPGNVGIERNLDATASIAALEISLPHGEFSRFCRVELQISTSYAARLQKLDELGAHVSDARAWAATQKHRLAECQSARNLVELVGDWLKREEPPKPTTAYRTRDAQSREESASTTQEDAALITECEKTISELKSQLAKRDDEISDLQRRLTEYDQDFIALRAPLPDEVREKALVALTSSHDRELATIAKRYHWRESDLRRELES
jgi:hypothetical protein